MADDRIVDDLRHARVHAGPESILNLLPARFRASDEVRMHHPEGFLFASLDRVLVVEEEAHSVQSRARWSRRSSRQAVARPACRVSIETVF